jgi:hypothetical protein
VEYGLPVDCDEYGFVDRRPRYVRDVVGRFGVQPYVVCAEASKAVTSDSKDRSDNMRRTVMAILLRCGNATGMM